MLPPAVTPSQPPTVLLSPSTESSFAFTTDTPSEVSDPFNDIPASVTPIADSPPATPSPPKMSASELMYHSEFYMPERMVVFQVDNTLYRVPAYPFFRNSEYFKNLLESHLSDGLSRGTSSEPIILTSDDVTCVDVERLLAIMFPRDIGECSATTLDEWSSILHLSVKWGFTKLRDLAAQKMFPLASAVDRIVLGRKHGFEAWLLGAFVEVCQRPESLSLSEACLMRFEDYVRINQAREAIYRLRAPKDASEIQHVVMKTFGLTVDSLQSTTPTQCPVQIPHTHRSTRVTSSATPDTASLKTGSVLDATLWDPSEPVDPRLTEVSAMLIDQELDARHGWNYITRDAAITSAVNSSDGAYVTLKRVITMIICRGIYLANKSPCAAGTWPELHARLCANLAKGIGPQYSAVVNEERLTRASLVKSIINDYCRQLVLSWDNPVQDDQTGVEARRQKITTFLTYLSRYHLLSPEVARECCTRLADFPEVLTAKDIRRFRLVLDGYMEMLDIPANADIMDPIFRTMSLLRYDWDYVEVMPDIALLERQRQSKQGSS